MKGLLRKRASDGGVFGARIKHHKHHFCSQIAAGMVHLALHNSTVTWPLGTSCWRGGMVCTVAD